MSDDQIDFYEALAQVRDYAYGIAEVLDKLVQTKAKAVTRDYDVNKIQWVEKTGAKGAYQLADPKTEGDKPDFKALLMDLKAHKGGLNRNGWFYWVFNDAVTMGRKKR